MDLNNRYPLQSYGFYNDETGFESITKQKEKLGVIDNTFIVFGHGVVDEYPTPKTNKILTFTAQEDDCSIAFKYSVYDSTGSATPPVYNLQYRLGEDEEWLDYEVRNPDDGEELIFIELNSKQSVQFKGINPDGFYYYEELEDDDYIEFNMTCQMTGRINASGDITSIVNGEGGDCLLPVWCFYKMFSDCHSLITAPSLPSTTLSDKCYELMFQGCSSLTTAPELPATTLAEGCYYGMFNNCTSLTTAPELPATTLAKGCYDSMFYVCISLTTAPELPATTLADECYYNMFINCTSLTTAPELPATTLVSHCYHNMFSGCTLLNSVTCLATDISATYCTANWLNGVAQTGTFTKADSMTDWTTGVSGIPSEWTVADA